MITFEIIVSLCDRWWLLGKYGRTRPPSWTQVLRCWSNDNSCLDFAGEDRKVDNSCRRHEGVLAALQHALIWHQLFREFISSFYLKDQSWGFARDAHWGQGFQAPKSFNMDPIQVLNCKVLQTFRLLAQFLDNRYVTKGEELRLTVRCLDQNSRMFGDVIRDISWDIIWYQQRFPTSLFNLFHVEVLHLWKVGRRTGAYASSIWHQNRSLVIQMVYSCYFFVSLWKNVYGLHMLLIRRKIDKLI